MRHVFVLRKNLFRYRYSNIAQQNKFVIVPLADNLLSVGLTDHLKGIVSAFYLAKLKGYKFIIEYNDNHSWISQLKKNNELIYFNEKSMVTWNIFNTRFLININRKNKVIKEWSTLLKTKKNIFWYSNNNYIQIIGTKNWQELWRSLFLELFDEEIIFKSQVNYKIGIHIRTSGCFGDFIDTYNRHNNVETSKHILLSNIKDYIVNLNLIQKDIYLASDSKFILNEFSELVTVNCKIIENNSDISHLNKSSQDDRLNLIYDFITLINCEKIISLYSDQFYKGVLPLYCSIIGEKDYTIENI